jgi:hypothetical protein
MDTYPLRVRFSSGSFRSSYADQYCSIEEDILHARIQTMGVAEHKFEVNIYGKSVTWHLYDVGGARGQRHTWVVSNLLRSHRA